MKSSKSAKNIKILLTDVDCVLTDGGMYYTSNGDVMKKFYTRDGMGVNMLRRKGIPTIIVTKEKTQMVKKWAKKMNIEYLYDGIQQKETILKIISKKYNVKNSEIGYIGDDINDVELLKMVGFSATPNDGIIEAQKIVHYICKKNGGEGAFREVADLLLRYRI
ncbi:HAD hydrolase family protein [Nitrosopumilus sp.]|jgi:3-deoxy-D-manno-octulosonate 8-phosphate phosphatase (KDO 8-P phosphatase)|nr:HAD hydrolase family protein [Nitrosopumilus sp.]